MEAKPMKVAPKQVFYMQPGKRKAKKMMSMWYDGCQQHHVTCLVDKNCVSLRTNFTPVFYGVAPTTVGVFNLAVRDGHPWLYIDNMYLTDRKGKRYYRVTWNALQHTGIGESDGHRLRRMFGPTGPVIKPRRSGDFILITLQSELYFHLLMPYTRQAWLSQVVRALRKHTDRKIVVRDKPHPGNPSTRSIPPFAEQLQGAHALVTLNSATAIEAMMNGVPAFVTDPNCAIAPVAGLPFSLIENPPEPDLLPWLQVLADNQWTQSEIERGIALEVLGKRKVIPVPEDIVQRSYRLADIGEKDGHSDSNPAGAERGGSSDPEDGRTLRADDEADSEAAHGHRREDSLSGA